MSRIFSEKFGKSDYTGKMSQVSRPMRRSISTECLTTPLQNSQRVLHTTRERERVSDDARGMGL